ncbi:MAG TPA: tRNA pseudouridine(55) synthase TruB [Rhodospirillaceae bacterium]|nr:MAG: tRNA pseudouridine(55) synthase TruB [Alphaproteobacteria bacterium GWF2_58_20]HAU29261.1 tRNA pseudouridine(55) synthase TruB [Rhodospirillaceae bacterium]
MNTSPSGWLIIDKPLGMTSNQVVGGVRRHLGIKGCGHAGTLDPLASGVLPIALGEATKTVAYAQTGSKDYAFTIRWGEFRTTDDFEGDVCETSPKRPTEEDILSILPRFIGEIQQVPPAYSAIKVDGKRAYALARAGQDVKLAARTVLVHDLRLVDMPSADEARFEVTSGKGFYVRSLGHDISSALGCAGYISALRRKRVGHFSLTHAMGWDAFTSHESSEVLANYLLPIETALDDIPALAATRQEAWRLRHGQTVLLTVAHRDLLTPSGRSEITGNGEVAVYSEGRLVALGAISGNVLRSVRGFNL